MRARPAGAVLLVGLLLACGGTAAAEVRVDGSLDPTSVETGDNAVLTLTIQGAASIDGDPRLTAPDGVRIRDAGESRSFSLVNGKFTQSIQKQYVVVALRPGEYTIGPVEVRVSGRAYQVGPFNLNAVRAAGAPPPPAPGRGPGAGSAAPPSEPMTEGGTPPVLVEMRAEPPEVFVGQQTILRISFLRRGDVGVLDARFVPPTTEGFWKEDLPPERQSTRQRGSVPYQASEILMALFPTRAGNLTVSPASVEVRYRDPRARGRRDPFGFFGFGGDAREAAPSSPPVIIHALPLPPDPPASFTGAVGRYSIQGKLDREEGAQGEPITWTFVIEGEGNVASVEGPRFPEIPGCRGYDAGDHVQTTKKQDRIGGSKSYSRVLVPEAAGMLDLPKIEWAYFDPQAGRYRLAEIAPRRVRVSPSSSAGGDGGAGRLGGAIRGIRTGGRLVARTSEHPWRGAAFWLIQVFPAGAIFCGFLLMRRREAAKRDPLGTRMRQAPRKLRSALRLVEMDAADPWGQLARALEEYLADQYGPAVRGMTRSSLAAHLASGGAAEEAAERMVGLLEKADLLRYTPATSSGKEDVAWAVREAADCAARLKRGPHA